MNAVLRCREMRAPYRYLLKLWILTVVLGPVFVALYQWEMEALGVLLVLFVFGLFFSLPTLLVGVIVLYVALRNGVSGTRLKVVLAFAGSLAIAISFALIKGSAAPEMSILYALAVIAATLLLKLPSRTGEVDPHDPFREG
jgi:hypothetical protein